MSFRFVPFALATAISAGAVVSGCSSRDEEASTDVIPVIRARVVSVALETTDKTYDSTGTIKPKFSATLASKVMSRVAEVSVREGDRVKKGQVLAILDSRELQSAVTIARANVNAAAVGVENAETAYRMEKQENAARIAAAEAQVAQARSLLGVANSRLDLAKAGTRTQEKAQANLAVSQAASHLNFASVELERTRRLVEEGAFARRQLDIAENAYNQAKAQYDTAVEAEKIALEGSRTQEITGAEQAARQAEAAVRQSEAALKSARASSMTVHVRKGDIQAARAQSKLSLAALDSAESSAGYAIVRAPFDGVITKRHVDPGAMATPGSQLVSIEGEDLRLEAVAPESVVTALAVGKSAPLVIESIGATFVAKIVELVPAGDPSSHTFTVRYELPRDGRLRSGMFGRVNIAIGRQKKMLIPADATWEVEGLRYIYVLNQQSVARLRIITVGAQQGNRIQVLSGLNPGERIIVGDRAGVQDGSRIEAN